MCGMIKESFKDNFSNMSTHMILRENVRCVELALKESFRLWAAHTEQ